MHRATIFFFLLLTTLGITSFANISYQDLQHNNVNIAEAKSTNVNQPGNTTPSNANLWLLFLPVLAIPLLFVAFRSRDDEDGDDLIPFDQSMIGMKGGSSEP